MACAGCRWAPVEGLKAADAVVFTFSHGFVPGAISVILPTFTFLYSKVFGVSATFLSATQLIAGMLAVFSVVLLGRLSDCLRSPLGRRRPFVLLLPPLLSLCWAFLLQPQILGAGREAYVYGVFFVLFQALYVGYIVVTAAWGVEIAPTGPARTRLYVVGALMSMTGAILGLGLYLATSPAAASSDDDDGDNAEDNALGRLLLSIIVICLLLGANGALFVWLPETGAGGVVLQPPLVPSMHAALGNEQFVMSLMLMIISGLANTVLVLLPYLLEYAMRLPNTETIYSAFGAVVLAFSIVATLSVERLVARYGRIPVVRAGLAGLGLTFFSVLPLSYSGSGWVVVGVGAPFGVCVGLIAANYSAVQADTIDYDELRSGRRREGQFVAVGALPDKFVSIAGAAMPLAVMAGLGFNVDIVEDAGELDEEDDQDQPVAATLALRLWCSIVIGSFSLLAAFVFRYYRLDEDTMEAVKEEVAKARAGLVARDPVTGKELPARTGGVGDDTFHILQGFASQGHDSGAEMDVPASIESLVITPVEGSSLDHFRISSPGGRPSVASSDLSSQDIHGGPPKAVHGTWGWRASGSGSTAPADLISDAELLETLTARERHTLAVAILPKEPLAEDDMDGTSSALLSEWDPHAREEAMADFARRTFCLCYYAEALLLQPLWMAFAVLISVHALGHGHPLAFGAVLLVVAVAFLTFYEIFRWRVVRRIARMDQEQGLRLAQRCAEMEEGLGAKYPRRLVLQMILRELGLAALILGVGSIVQFTGP